MNRLSYRGAVVLGIVSLGTRAFFAAYVDSPELLGALWLGVLAGGVVFLPAVAAMYAVQRLRPDDAPEDALVACAGPVLAKIFLALLALVTLYDAASAARILMASSIYEEQRLTAPYLAVLPALLAAALVALSGANGVGGAAGLFMRFAPFLILPIIGTHLGNYRPEHLLPVLGMGWPTIFTGAGKVAGALAPIAALWLVQSGRQTGFAQRERRAKPWLFPALYGAIVLLAATWAVLALMLETNVFSVPQSRIYRLRLLLSNGSSPTYLQLLYVTLWYGALLCSQGFSLFATARLTTAIAPKCPFPLAIWLCALAAALIAGFRLAEQPIAQRLAPWQAVVTGAVLLLTAIAGYIRKGGKAPCAPPKS